MITNIVKNLFKKYGPIILRRCLFIIKNKQYAVEVTEDIFVQILLKKRAYKNDKILDDIDDDIKKIYENIKNIKMTG